MPRYVAPRGGVVYFWVDDIDAVAAKFDIAPEQAPWAREVELTDPDGNRIRAGQARFAPQPTG